MTNAESDELIRVLVLGKSAVSRAGLEMIVRGAKQLLLTGSIAGMNALGAHIRSLQPDVVLAEMDLEDLAVVEHSVSSVQMPPLVALVDRPEVSWIAHALQLRIKAILPRAASAAEVVLAVQSANA